MHRNQNIPTYFFTVENSPFHFRILLG